MNVTDFSVTAHTRDICITLMISNFLKLNTILFFLWAKFSKWTNNGEVFSVLPCSYFIHRSTNLIACNFILRVHVKFLPNSVLDDIGLVSAIKEQQEQINMESSKEWVWKKNMFTKLGTCISLYLEQTNTVPLLLGKIFNTKSIPYHCLLHIWPVTSVSI
jgi:hypothetical protein